MSHWGWHSFPPPLGLTAAQIPATGTFEMGRVQGPDFERHDDATTYYASLAWSGGCQLTVPTNRASNKIVIEKAEFGNQDHWIDVT
jgi:hypothetical protein